MNKQQIIKQIEKLQLQLKELENQDYQQIIYNKKEFRIYKWDKTFKEFPMPKDFDFAEYFDVVTLINNKKIKFTEPYAETYICKSQFKQNKKYCLSTLYLSNGLDLYSDSSDLDYSDDGGRVVICK